MNKLRSLIGSKCDVGSPGGHTTPSEGMLSIVKSTVKHQFFADSILSFYIGSTGDDINILNTHDLGLNSATMHNLHWKLYEEATNVANKEGNYGAGQDLKADAPSGNLKGKGPGVAELPIGPNENRKAEVFLVFWADKTGPGCFNFPLLEAFGRKTLALSMPKFRCGFKWHIVDMDNPYEESTIILNTPQDLPDIEFLLKAVNRFAVRSIFSNYTGEQIVSASTDRLHNIPGKNNKLEYTGKDDPILMSRAQGNFLAPEELVAPFSAAHLVYGGTRGSLVRPLMPVALNTPVTGADCQPIVSCAGFSVNSDGFLSKPVDFFGNPSWDMTRQKALSISDYLRVFSPIEPASAPNSELEYGEWSDTLKVLENQFKPIS